MESYQSRLIYLTNNYVDFFAFMQKKYPVYKNSNIFLRDVQYAIYLFFMNKGIQIKYPEAEKAAYQLMENLLSDSKLKKISSTTWKLNFFVTTDVIKVNN